MPRLPADRHRLYRQGARHVDGDGLQFVAVPGGVADVGHHRVQRADEHLVDEHVAGGRLLLDVLHHLRAAAALLQRLLGEHAQGALLLGTDADAEPRLAEVVQRLDAVRVALVDEDDEPVGRDVFAVHEQVAHLVHERLIAGEIGVGVLAGLHVGDEDAAAVVLGDDLDPLACLELLEGLLDGRPQHGPRVQHELRPVGPIVALHDLEAVLLEQRQTAVAGGEVAGEAQSCGRLPAAGQHGHRDAGRHAVELRQAHRFQSFHLPHRGVPDEAGIDGADAHVVGHVVDGHRGDGGAAVDLVPALGLAEGVARDLADGGGVGVGLRQAHVGPQQVVETGDLLRVTGGDGEDGMHVGQGDGFGEEPLVAAELEVTVVGGQVQVAGAGVAAGLDLGQERLRPAVVGANRDTVPLFVLPGGGLDGRLDACGTVDDDGALGRGAVAGRPEEEANEDNEKGDGAEEGEPGAAQGGRSGTAGTHGWVSVVGREHSQCTGAGLWRQRALADC